MERTIYHADVDYCYAQIELQNHPEWQNAPLAVGGSREDRHGIILAKCPIAKKAGIKTGHALWQARQLCPEVRIVPPRMNLYIDTTDRIREIYSQFTDLVEDFGIDESFLDVTGCVSDGEKAARELQQRIRAETGLTVSFGVAWNKIFAKLGSDMKKPFGVSVITKQNYKDVVWPLPAEDLLMVGKATKKKLNNMGIKTIGDIAKADPDILRRRLGKHGLMLSTYANGYESSPVRRGCEMPPEKSIGNSWTTPRNMENDSDVYITLTGLCESVGMRLRRAGFLATIVDFSYRTSELKWASHQRKLNQGTDITKELLDISYLLYNERKVLPLRSIGVRAAGLISVTESQQLDLFSDYVTRDNQRKLDTALDGIRGRFGYDSIQRGTRYMDKNLGRLNALKHTVHPIGFQA